MTAADVAEPQVRALLPVLLRRMSGPCAEPTRV